MSSPQIKMSDAPQKLRGRIINDKNGYQAIMTESKEVEKRLIHCLGFSRIPNATTGDFVELTYVTRVTFNKSDDRSMRLGKDFESGPAAIKFIDRMTKEQREPEYWGFWKGVRV
jgi:hypothetical protein